MSAKPRLRKIDRNKKTVGQYSLLIVSHGQNIHLIDGRDNSCTRRYIAAKNTPHENTVTGMRIM